MTQKYKFHFVEGDGWYKITIRLDEKQSYQMVLTEGELRSFCKCAEHFLVGTEEEKKTKNEVYHDYQIELLKAQIEATNAQIDMIREIKPLIKQSVKTADMMLKAESEAFE